VDDCCRAVAAAADFDDYEIGFQNHSNRPIEWTQPDIDAVIDAVDADTVIVDAISFMHEQSETLAELDHDLRERAEARGIEFLRVPIPHDDARFAAVLADLVLARLDVEEGALPDNSDFDLGQCRCRPDRATRCTNYRLERSGELAIDAASRSAAANRPGMPTRDS
jgi:ferrochelatase